MQRPHDGSCPPAGLSAEDYRKARMLIKDIVLQTDMVKHSELMGKVKQHTKDAPDPGRGAALYEWLGSEKAKRHDILAMLVHAADISNTFRPPGPCGLWAKRVTDGAPRRTLAPDAMRALLSSRACLACMARAAAFRVPVGAAHAVAVKRERVSVLPSQLYVKYNNHSAQSTCSTPRRVLLARRQGAQSRAARDPLPQP